MRADSRVMLISVKPRYISMLLAGTKTVELRRTRPNTAPNTLVVLYASSPRRQIVGTARIRSIEQGSPSEIWRLHRDLCGVSRDEFDSYFHGATSAVALTLESVDVFDEAHPLTTLRERVAGFRPPQSFAYLSTLQLRALLGPQSP